MAQENYEQSSFRENMLEHLFTGRCLQTLWRKGVYSAEVLKADVDASGYDVIIEAVGITRHIQLKSSSRTAKTARQSVSMALTSKPSGCVIWIVFDPSNVEFDHFLWFGNSAGLPLPDISSRPLNLPGQMRKAKRYSAVTIAC